MIGLHRWDQPELFEVFRLDLPQQPISRHLAVFGHLTEAKFVPWIGFFDDRSVFLLEQDSPPPRCVARWQWVSADLVHRVAAGVEVSKAPTVASNRESKALGIGARVERFLAEVFRQLDHTE